MRATTLLLLTLLLATLPCAASNDWIWVGKTDEAKSCAQGVSLEKMGKQLKRAKVSVKDQKKMSDGKMHMQMCGAEKGDSNAYLIPSKDVTKAEKLGFKKMPEGEAK